MKRAVHVASLTPGRCFTLKPSEDVHEEGDQAERLTTSQSILAPEAVWKVLGAEAGGVRAESATKEVRVFTEKTLVIELPRQGWDRLAQRAASEPTDG